MVQRMKILKWVMAAWLILWGSMSSASFGQTYGVTYRGGSSSHRVVCTTAQTNTSPAYQFKSTSAYTSGIGSAYAPQLSEPFAASAPNRLRKEGLGDPSDDDNGVGEIPDPAPVGEPFVLLLLAGLFVLYKRRRTA